MSTPAGKVIAHSLSIAQALLQRYTADLTPQEYLHRPTAQSNCTAWIIGHLILSDRNALMAMDVSESELPSLPAGFEQRFGRGENAPQAADFGDVTILMPLFNDHHSKLIDVVKRAAPELLDKPREKPHPLFSTMGELANFMAAHVSMHAGQITMIRRSLGRPPLV